MQLVDFLPLFALLPLLQPVSTFKIDATCKDQDAELMRDGMLQAFDMARQSVEAINQEPRDANVNRLIQLLFGSQDSATTDKVRESFEGILGVVNENQNADSEDTAEEVVVYCDLESRIEKNERGEWVEKNLNQVISDPPDHELDECRGTTDLTLAYTWNPGATTWQVPGGWRHRNHAAQITICPWFLEWSRGARYKTWNDIRAKTSLAKWALPIGTKGWPFTPFDATNLLDKVLLHELTHTHAGGRTEDVSDGFEWNLPFRAAYGWKAAKKLASMNPPNEREDERANNNADSLALFGSGIRLLNETPPKYVKDSGYITKTSPNFARNAPQLELMYPRSPAPVPNPAFEGFITRIRVSRSMETHVH